MTERELIDLSDTTVVVPSRELGAPSLAAALEALLIIADEPMSTESLAAAVGRPVPDVAAALTSLAQEYRDSERGFDLRESAGGWRYYTSPQCEVVVTRHVTEGMTARLSQAALETLAVVAYRQPVTRSHISAVRGVNVDGVVRTLLSRDLITAVGSDPNSGAALYGTTEYFLDRLGIDSLDELPPLSVHVPFGEALGELLDADE